MNIRIKIQRSILLVFAAAASAFPCQAGWIATSLHPEAQEGSYSFGVLGNQQVGAITRDFVPHASLWSGTANSWVDLNPRGSFSLLYGASGEFQAGYVVGSWGAPHASLWNGTAASIVDLNPQHANASIAFGIDGTSQAGRAEFDDRTVASLWNSSAESWINLNPVNAIKSEAHGIGDGQQVGFADINGLRRASLWSGTPESWVDLTPPISPYAVAEAAADGQQVGAVYLQIGLYWFDHAALWNGTADSWVDLNPVEAYESNAFAVFGGLQAGRVSIEGNYRASIWNGTPESWENLESYLSSDYVGSQAFGVWTNGDVIFVSGVAYNNTLSRQEAILWTHTVPEPDSLALCIVAVLAIGANCRFSRRRS